MAAVFRENKNIRQISERGAIRNGASKSHLLLSCECTEAKRVADAFLNYGSRNVASPIRRAEEVVDEVDVKTRRVGGDFVTCGHVLIVAQILNLRYSGRSQAGNLTLDSFNYRFGLLLGQMWS